MDAQLSVAVDPAVDLAAAYDYDCKERDPAESYLHDRDPVRA